METVKEFLRLRQEKQGAAAAAMVHPNASVGGCWGYHHGAGEFVPYLREEERFTDRTFLHMGELKQVDENTVMRIYQYQRPINPKLFYYGVAPRWREVYYVKEGQIKGVSCFRQEITPWDALCYYTGLRW